MYQILYTMKNQQEYTEIYQKVDMYLDKAMNEDDEREIINQIEKDPDYSHVFYAQKNFRDFLKRSVHRPPVSPTLIQSIKEKIRIV